ncbi:MAG: hypothetical protein AB7S72_08210 [Draconibacterium sp.]
MGFKEKYARKKLARMLANMNRYRVVPDVNTVKVIGVIWQPSQKDAFTWLKNYFVRDQIIFRGFCVFEEMASPHPDPNALTVKELNWWGLPRHEKVSEFVDMNFDILFNLALSQNLALEYITALSQAKFKVGSSQDTNNYFDLNINIGENNDALYLAKQQIFYLAQLKKI